MLTLIPKVDLKKIILNLVILFLSSNLSVLAQDLLNPETKEELTALENQAREYRDEGIKFQDIGDLDSAMKLYQKAIEVDPVYAVAYNDLGVVYEAKSMPDRAEESYVKAIKIDPYYLSTYSNLALLYEERRDFGKAAYCWRKRAELGDLEDPWTRKARERLEDIHLSLSQRPAQDTQEKDIVKLMKDVANEKYLLRHDDKLLARKYLKKAEDSYNREDYATAVKSASDAQALDPDNKAIEEFIERSQHRALSR
jgi:tetratricopeptide (TPR) repeat protein